MDGESIHPTALVFPMVFVAILGLFWMMWQMSGAIDYSALISESIDSAALDNGQNPSAGDPSIVAAQSDLTNSRTVNPNGKLQKSNLSPATNSGRGATGGAASLAGASAGDCSLSKKFPNSVRQWCGLITKYASLHQLPADLIGALIWQESGGNPGAYSNSGAVGLMQVMSRDGVAAAFQCAGGPCFSNRPSIVDLQDPEFNVQYGVKMLAELIGKTGSYREALRSYGPMDVGYYYADTVLSIMEQYGK
jgi:soluble lytic murein transglycosylase-like protein